MEVEITCPCCFDENATITVDLKTGQAFHCSDCDTEFTLDNIRAVLASWQKILPWVESHPNNK